MQVNDCLRKFAKTRGLEQFEKLTDEEKTFCNTYDQYLKKLLVSMPRAQQFLNLYYYRDALFKYGSVLLLNDVCFIWLKIVFGIKHFTEAVKVKIATDLNEASVRLGAGSMVRLRWGK